MTLKTDTDANGVERYCYSYSNKVEAPTLRLHPGDWLTLRLKNELPKLTSGHGHPISPGAVCGSAGPMTPSTTNVHFHGMNVPPTCHADDVLNTLIQASDPPFEYKVQIPFNEPPGLYWYHPHPHGFSEAQVLGGAAGALIVEGIEQADPDVAGLPERVLIVRGQDLPMQQESDPDAPECNLSLNFVPVPYPAYPPAVIRMRPAQREFWRVLNASADTYIDVQLLFNGKPQTLGLVGLDGVPLAAGNGVPGGRTVPETDILIPPAGRAEFVVDGPPEGISATFVTRSVDTGPMGDSDPSRPMATIQLSPTAPEPASLPARAANLSSQRFAWLSEETPIRQRKLYFSESPIDPSDPTGPTNFFITVEGQTPHVFDPAAPPSIITQIGAVEDWTIENRSQENHAFHIHQLHFLVREKNGVPVNEPVLLDTINVPYWDGKSSTYPSVKLRLDFRDPEIAGTFVYHCHILEHEDGGMMGKIEVDPAP
ncbi:MAG: multicopper oxidase domain-containing protein [Acidobacteriaceae bacterium]|nr:multicopper oxidase domain-containing protein [Acidobacteriaceae bacterium]